MPTNAQTIAALSYLRAAKDDVESAHRKLRLFVLNAKLIKALDEKVVERIKTVEKLLNGQVDELTSLQHETMRHRAVSVVSEEPPSPERNTRPRTR